MSRLHPAGPHLHCTGIALLAGLVLMTAISLLALVATSSMLLQTRMAANFRDIQQARLNSVRAVLQGEAFLLNLQQDERLPGCLERCFAAPLDQVIHPAAELPAFPEYQDSAWWQNQGVATAAESGSGDTSPSNGNPDESTPRYLIEEIHFETAANLPAPPMAPPLDGIGYYRVLGRGSGKGPGAIVVSEAIVARPWSLETRADQEVSRDTSFCAPFSSWYDCGRMAWRQRR